MVEREVRYPSTGITAQKEGKTKPGAKCSWVLGILAPPAPTNVYISDNRNNIKSTNEIEHGNNRPDEVNNHGYHGKCSETNNLCEITFAF